MSQIFTIAAVGASLIAGARLARRALERSAAQRQKEDFAKRGDAAKSVGDLAPDPENGVYRPKRSPKT